jgi:hypothetical protein
LRRRAAEESEAKLENAARLVAPVGEITVKSPGNAEFAGKKHERTERDGLHVDPGPKHGDARQMDTNEEKTGKR